MRATVLWAVAAWFWFLVGLAADVAWQATRDPEGEHPVDSWALTLVRVACWPVILVAVIAARARRRRP